MPIYSYRCAACGHTKDVLRKLSDPPLADCPACGAPRFEKQVTAAGFQLKGSGWYVTDFRDGQKGSKADKADKTDKAAEPAAPSAAPAAPAPSTSAAPPAAASPAPAAAPAPAPPPASST